MTENNRNVRCEGVIGSGRGSVVVAGGNIAHRNGSDATIQAIGSGTAVGLARGSAAQAEVVVVPVGIVSIGKT